MSGNEFEVGRVYRATVRGERDVLVWRMWRGYWVTGHEIADVVTHADELVTDVRPLVVLDLDAASVHMSPEEHRRGIVALIRDVNEPDDYPISTVIASIADQIAAQITPPKVRMEEPPWGTVVTAWVESGDARGKLRWQRLDSGRDYWTSENGRFTVPWSDLIDPEVTE